MLMPKGGELSDEDDHDQRYNERFDFPLFVFVGIINVLIMKLCILRFR